MTSLPAPRARRPRGRRRARGRDRGQCLRRARSSSCPPGNRRRNPRSCETATTAPGYAARAASRSSTRSRAMWFVGSSRTRRSAGRVTRFAICSRRCWPADRAATGTCRSSSRNRPSASSGRAYSSGSPGLPAAKAASSGSRLERAGSSCARYPIRAGRRTVPASGSRSPARTRSRVVLPAPFSPVISSRSPARRPAGRRGAAGPRRPRPRARRAGRRRSGPRRPPRAAPP